MQILNKIWHQIFLLNSNTDKGLKKQIALCLVKEKNKQIQVTDIIMFFWNYYVSQAQISPIATFIFCVCKIKDNDLMLKYNSLSYVICDYFF